MRRRAPGLALRRCRPSPAVRPPAETADVIQRPTDEPPAPGPAQHATDQRNGMPYGAAIKVRGRPLAEAGMAVPQQPVYRGQHVGPGKTSIAQSMQFALIGQALLRNDYLK